MSLVESTDDDLDGLTERIERLLPAGSEREELVGHSYFVAVELSPTTSAAIRTELWRGLQESLFVLACHPEPSRIVGGDCEGSFDLLVEETVSAETVTNALEDLPEVEFVEVVDVTSRTVRGGRSDRSWTAGRSDSSHALFKQLQRDTTSPGLDVLEDPEYIDLLDSFGELSAPDDALSLEDLLEVEPTDTVGGGDERDDRSETASTTGERLEVEPAVERVVEALESGNVPDEAHQRLREALGDRTDDDGDGHTELDRLSRSVRSLERNLERLVRERHETVDHGALRSEVRANSRFRERFAESFRSDTKRTR